MARRLCGFLLLALLAASPACKRKHRTDAIIPEQAVALVSVVNVSDPDASAQLTNGFYQLEDNAWRWTARNFTVALKTPPGASQNGGRLTMKVNFPGVVFSKLGPVKLTAKVNGQLIGVQQFSQPGDGVVSFMMPPRVLSGDAVSVDFSCDKALPPTASDARELALVVTSVGLEPPGPNAQ